MAARGRDEARSNPSLADRARWFATLGWPQDCEDAFAATRVGDDGGLEFHELRSGESIALVRCANGAYQPSSIVVRASRDRSPGSARALTFEVPESPDGLQVIVRPGTELSGELQWIGHSDSIVVLSLARQTGDCGTWTRYRFIAGAPTTDAAYAAFPCPEVPGEPVDFRPEHPPENWKPVPLH